MPRALYSRSNGSGTGAPPHMMTRKDDRSAASKSGCWATNSSIAGTAKVVVTRYSRTSAIKRAGSKARCSTTCPPFCQQLKGVTLRPPIWNSGAITRLTSFSDTSAPSAPLMLAHQKLPWVSMAPLGRPVVPDVYMITATSSSAVSTRSASGAASPTNSVIGCQLVAGPSADRKRRQHNRSRTLSITGRCGLSTTSVCTPASLMM